jgi:hypothetical protein
MTINRNSQRLFWVVFLIVLLLAAVQIILNATSPDPSHLLINEVLFANRTGLADEDGDLSDWVEIYNRGSQPVNLGGWFLTDDPDQPEKWPFPDRVLGAQEYLLVFASGKDRENVEALHANFKLNRDGDFLGLYNVFEKRFMDRVPTPLSPQFGDVTYGRYDDTLQFGYLGNPTPGASNNLSQVWAGVVAPVIFSQPHGFYEQPLAVELSTATPGAVIYYTTNGSDPTPETGLGYTKPLEINSTFLLRAAAFKNGWLPSAVETNTYIYVDSVLTQTAHPPHFPEYWGVHQVDFEDYRAGMPVEADYEMDPEIVNDPRYHDRLIEGLTAIPSLSIVTDMPHFTHIYSNPLWRGMPSERAVSVELIAPDGSEPGFQANAGLRIQGGVGRNPFYPKHSFRLFFRSAYGPSRLAYPFFSNSPVTKFNTLVLRGGVNRSFAGTAQNKETTYIRDEWLRATQLDISGIGSHGRFVHVYLNGLYWGLYNVVERPDASFMASYFGGDDDDWVVMNHGGTVDGPDSALVELIEQYKSLATAGADPQNRAKLRQTITSLINIPQFVDYIILNWYSGNQDWGENNWYAARRLPNGQVNYFVWDAEKIFFEGAEIYFGRTQVSRSNVVLPIFDLLWDDVDFRMFLADRLYAHLFNNGALTDDNARTRWLNISAPLEQAIVGESARWGDARQEPPITRDDWLKARDNVLAQMDGNAARLITQAREKGYYPPIDPPEFNRQSGLVAEGFELTMAAAEGVIYYTTDGSDPRIPVTGEIAGGSLVYRAPLVLTTSTTIKARVWQQADGEPVWSALHEATFRMSAVESKLAITEIMYNPLGGNRYEFIELKNIGDTEISLGNMYFDQGINVAFPPAFPLLVPGEFTVLVRDPASFAERYPNVPVAGTYRGKLSNQGETITLKDQAGNTVVSVSYDDENGWPISADGRGDSLVLVNPAGDPHDPRNWRASANIHGSPGSDESELR